MFAGSPLKMRKLFGQWLLKMRNENTYPNPHPEEARSAVSKDEVTDLGDARLGRCGSYGGMNA